MDALTPCRTDTSNQDRQLWATHATALRFPTKKPKANVNERCATTRHGGQPRLSVVSGSRRPGMPDTSKDADD